MKPLIGSLMMILMAAPNAAPGPPARVPVLVELFTSEGCSSCPPADALLAELQKDQPVEGAEVVALGLHVDYWDKLGWRDQFSSASFTERQQSYARVFGPDRVYTPQMVVDGQAELVGSDRSAAALAIRTAAARPHLAVHIAARGSGDALRMSIEAPALPSGSEPVQVLAAVTESGLTSEVQRGENRGHTLQHVAVARKVQALGQLGPDAFVAEGQWRVERTWKPAGLRAIVWLQGTKTKHVYGAASAPVLQ